MSRPADVTTVSGNMLEFLRWVQYRERTYADAMEAWRTSCPRLSVWEDANADGLIRLVRHDGSSDAVVELTPNGLALLASR